MDAARMGKFIINTPFIVILFHTGDTIKVLLGVTETTLTCSPF